MKRGFFLVVSVAFAILALFVLYLDVARDCGSLRCVARYVSTGESLSDSQFPPKKIQFFDSSSDSNILSFALKKTISKIIYPFVEHEEVLLQAGLEPPVITGIAPPSFSSSSDTDVSVIGQNFDLDALLLIGGDVIESSRLTITPTEILFSYIANELPAGTHQVSVTNPSSGLVSNSFGLTLTTSPVITSLSPQTIVNNDSYIVNINGNDFNPFAVVFEGIILDSSSGLWQYVSPNLIRLNIPSGLSAGDFDIQIYNLDGALSNIMVLRSNYPFVYFLSSSPSPGDVLPGSSFVLDVSINSVVFTEHEEVVLSLQTPLGITSSFVGSDRCIPNIPSTVVQGIAYCNLAVNFDVGSIPSGNYNLSINSVSALNSVKGQINFSLNVIPLGQPDGDLDEVPDSIDLCPNTPANVKTTYGINVFNGCPIPNIYPMTASLTTDFSNVPNLFAVENLRMGIAGKSSVTFRAPISMLWVNTTAVPSHHLPIGLGEWAINLSENYVFINSTKRPIFNVSAEVTFFDTGLTNPVLYRDGVICDSSKCHILSFDTISGDVVANVSGFSSYSVSQGSCGDSMCSIAETCSSCSADCGSCLNNGPPPSGSSGGGGGGGGSKGSKGSSSIVYRATPQCSDGVDNDLDSLVDYPNDLGCLNTSDDTEVDSSPLVGDSEGQGESLDSSSSIKDKDYSMGVVFWIVLVVLLGGITLVIVRILKYSRNRKKFSDLAEMTSKS